MKINRDNYELFFIDYLDNALSEADKLEIEAFLSLNPDLHDELQSMQELVLEVPAGIHFGDTSGLKKEAGAAELPLTVFEESCIAYIEGDMQLNEEIRFEKELKESPAKMSELNLFRKTILKPSLTDVFVHKEDLRKTPILPFVRRAAWILSVAAIWLIGWFLLMPTEQVNSPAELYAINDSLYPYFLDSVYQQNSKPVTKQPANQSSGTAKTTNVSTYTPKTNTVALANVVATEDVDETVAIEREDVEIFAMIPLKESGSEIQTPDMPELAISTHQSSRRLISYPVYVIRDSVQHIIEKSVKEKVLGVSEQKEVNFWTVAEAGMKGLSRLTKSDIKLENEYDDEGNIEVFALSTPLFSFARPVNSR